MKTMFEVVSSIVVVSMFLSNSYASGNEKSNPDGTLGTIVLDPVVVTEQNRNTKTEDRNSYTASAMSTTTGLALTPKETPQSVSVITKTQLDDLNVTSMDEALSYTTGVNVVRDRGTFRYQSRGFSINRIEEDGLATSVNADPNFGNPLSDGQSMTGLAIYDHIEVVRGVTGLTQGVGEPGGTINAVRKKPTPQTKFEGDVSADRFGELTATADVSGSLNAARTFRGRLVGSFERLDSFQEDIDGTNGLLYGVTDYDLGKNTTLTFGGLYQRRDEPRDVYGLPMAEGGGDAGFSRDAYLGYDWAYSVRKKMNWFGEVEHWLTDDWKIVAKFTNIQSEADSVIAAITGPETDRTWSGLSAGGTLNTNWFSKFANESDQWVFNVNINGKYRLLNQEHDLFAGYTWSYEDSESKVLRIRERTAFNPYSFSGNELPAPDWSDPDDRFALNRTITMHGILFGTRFNPLDRFHILGGTRWTRWNSDLFQDYDLWNHAPDSDPDTRTILTRSRLVPYLGLTFDITPTQSLYASYTNIFEPQDSLDKNDVPLDPILGENYEIGWKAEWLDRSLNTALALFQVQQKNRPIGVYDEDRDRWYAEPLGEVRSRGIDVEVSGNLTQAWKLFAGYTFNESEYMEDEDDNLKGMNFSKHTPKHMFRFYMNYRLPGVAERWSVGMGVNWQSDIESMYGVKQGSYALCNAAIQYDVSDSVQLSLIGKNLLDKRYFQTNSLRTNSVYNHFGEPLNVMLKISWKM